MKKVYFLLLFLIFTVDSWSQSQRRSLLIQTPSIAQIESTSCWAASMEMALKSFDKNAWYNQKRSRLLSPLTFNKLLDSLKQVNRFGSFKVSTTMKSDDVRILKGRRYDIVEADSLPWVNFQDNFELSKSPMIFWKKFGTANGQYHVNIFRGYEHTKLQANQMRFIFVNDPWPNIQEGKKGGANYILTYEFYKKKPIALPVSRLPNNAEFPNMAVLYDFKLPPKTTTFYQSNSSNWDNRKYANIVSKFSTEPTTPKIIEQANKTLSHVQTSASDSLLEYTKITKTSTQVDVNSILKVVTFFLVDNDVRDTLTTSTSKITFDKYKLFDGYTTLFEDAPSYLVTLKTNNKPSTVIAVEATDKKELYTTRIERFNTSVAAVVARVVNLAANNPNLPQSFEAIKTAYFYRSYNEANDFIILEQQGQSNPLVLIDLSKGMDLFDEPTKDSIQTDNFNFRTRILEGENLDKMKLYLATTTKSCENDCKYKISEAGMSMIDACQKLISKSDSTASYIQNDGSIYLTCRNFKIPAKYLYSDLRKDGLISIFANYAPNIEGKDSYFNFQWVPSYTQNDYDVFKANNCSTCLPKPPMNYPYPSGSENAVYELIFVPVQSYKMLRSNSHKNEYPNWARLKNVAIRPSDMETIENPRLEASDGYFNMSEGEQKYLSQYKADLPIYPIKGILSSKGVVCDVILKDSGKRVQCYVLNSYDSALLWQEEK